MWITFFEFEGERRQEKKACLLIESILRFASIGFLLVLSTVAVLTCVHVP